MPILRAFVAKSFHPRDEAKVKPIEAFLNSFSRSGLIWETGEPSEPESVSEKVRQRIDKADLFVGILTRRHPLFASDGGLSGAWRRIRGQTSAWSAAPWVLQEIGYALRARKDLILFQESQLDLGALQGDLEYVSYDTASPAVALTSASEMINTLLAQHSGFTVETVASVAEVEASRSDENEEPSAPEVSANNQPTLNELFVKMTDALRERDWTEAEKCLQEALPLVRAERADGVLAWQGFYYSRRFQAGEPEALASLEALHHENPASHMLVGFIAQCYRSYGEPLKAYQYYWKAASSSEGETAFNYKLSAAECLEDNTDYDRAEGLLLNLWSESGQRSSQKAQILRRLFALWKDSGKPFNSYGAAELLLRDNPAEGNVRFDVALLYSAAGCKELNLLHCKTLTQHQSTNASVLHNFAVACGKASLSISAIAMYKRALDLGLTLAASNMSYRYLDAGFAEEATTLLERAMQQPDCDPAVTKALGEIVERRESERETEDDLLQKANDQRRYLASFGEAVLEGSLTSLDGQWAFPFATTNLRIEGEKLVGEGTVEDAQASLTLALLGQEASDAEPKPKRVYRVQGKLEGRACKFDVSSHREGLAGLLTTRSEFEGLIFFDAEGGQGRVAKLKSGVPTEFYDVRKL